MYTYKCIYINVNTYIYTLQHTATPCNTPQHPATHRNTLQQHHGRRRSGHTAHTNHRHAAATSAPSPHIHVALPLLHNHPLFQTPPSWIHRRLQVPQS